MKKPDDTKQLILFFAITFVWTWGFGFVPVFMGMEGTKLGTFLFYFGGGAPSVTALIIVFLTYSKEQRKDYFMRCFRFRYMGVKWLVVTVLFFTLISAIGIWIAVYFLGHSMPEMKYVHGIMQNPLNLFLVLFLSVIYGPLNEEFGWRGYALDRLLVRYGFTKATLFLGFVWGIWHLPWFFTPGQAQYNLLQDSLFDAMMYIPSVMIFNFAVSYVYIKTKRSILSGALVHLFSNLLGSQLLSPYSTEISMTIRYTKMFFCGCLALYCIFSKRLKEDYDILFQEYKR